MNPPLTQRNNLAHLFTRIIIRPSHSQWVATTQSPVTRLQVGQLRNRCSIPGKGRLFFLQTVQGGYEARPASACIGTGGTNSGEIKRPVCEADQSPQYSAEVNSGWSYTLSSFRHHGGSRNNFHLKVRLGRYSINRLRIMKVWVSNIVLWGRCDEGLGGGVSLSTST
jgi:hypothetical protein